MNADELEAYILPWMIERTKERFIRPRRPWPSLWYIATTEDLFHSRSIKPEDFGWRWTIREREADLSGMPFKMGICHASKAAPLLGEHNSEIYAGVELYPGGLGETIHRQDSIKPGIGRGGPVLFLDDIRIWI